MDIVRTNTEHLVITVPSHFNIVVDKQNGTRVFTPWSMLYRCLHHNNDVTQLIERKVQIMSHKDTMKSLQVMGRDANKRLKAACYNAFNVLEWDQEKFQLGYDYIKETYYYKIPEDIKHWYIGVIEEAFYTMQSQCEFHAFIRNAAEGGIRTKHNFAELLMDMLVGVEFAAILDACQ